jgi:tetratricopeptide (TPR) repeat protein
MNPIGYHVTSLLLHAANAVLVYLVARRLLARAVAGAGGAGLEAAAALGALLFAVHPLRVESVAWITERRDVLSGFFYLGALLAALRAADPLARERGHWRRWYALSLAVFALALLSKSMAVSLPLVLLVLDVYPLGRLRWPPGAAGRRALLEKAPYLALSLGAGAVALVALAGTGNMSTVARVGWVDRIAISLYSLAFYLWKTALPLGLSPLYELPAHIDPLAWPFVLSGAAVAALTALAVAGRRRWPALGAAWAAYVAILLPVAGAVQNGYQIAADRYTYLPSIAWAVLAAGVALAGGRRRAAAGPWARPALVAVPAVAIALLAGLTWAQCRVWRSTEALWAHALAIAPSAMGYTNVAVRLDKQGRLGEALALHEKAVALQPDFALARFNMAVTLQHQGRLGAAAESFERALALRPGDVSMRTSLAAVLLQQGRWAAAAEQCRQALAADPAYPEAHNNLAVALGRLGDVEGSIRHYERALAGRPAYDAALHNLGNALLRQGRTAEAVARLRQAVAANPGSAEMRNSLGVALAREGRLAEAAAELENAVRLDPRHAQARDNLALVRAHLPR